MRVVVVGGGTAGWMTAAALVSILPGRASVHLVESEAIGIVGVGEATLPNLRAFIARLGIGEAAFMAATRATFKLGIELRNWARVGDRYFHPFGAYGRDVNGIDFHHLWRRAAADGADGGGIESFSMATEMARLGRFSHPGPDPESLAGRFGYAYQFDATLFAPLLRAHAEALGAIRSEGRVVAVARHPGSGDIASITLDDGRLIEGDLFVDCSGFRSLLLGEALGEPFEDWSHWLPCDSAVAMPCRTAGPITPYTSAIATEAGWRWRIPLQHRTGNGHVYARAFTSDEVAERLLVEAVEGEALAAPRVLRFTAGRRRRSWVGNCIGIGLAGGFLEPLESTSIYLIQLAITQLVALFPERRIADEDRDEFNRILALDYERIRDFLILHYHATMRDDAALWRYVRAMPIPDSLAEKIALFRRYGRVIEHSDGVFHKPSWLAVYLGQRVVPEAYDVRADAIPAPVLGRGLETLRREIAATVAAMPGHEAFIAAQRAAAA